MAAQAANACANELKNKVLEYIITLGWRNGNALAWKKPFIQKALAKTDASLRTFLPKKVHQKPAAYACRVYQPASPLTGFRVRMTLLPKSVNGNQQLTHARSRKSLPQRTNFNPKAHMINMKSVNAEKIPLPEPLCSLIGGVERGAVTNFYGPPGVGKTNICILAALECIKNGGQVVYIDTEGGLSPERVMQISGDEASLEKIMVIEPKTFEEQGVAVKNLEGRDFGMLILDSAVALYRLKCAEPDKEALEANKELSVQLSILSNTARKRNIPVIITAHTFRNWDTGENQIIGGDAIRYWSKSIIFVEHTGRMSERKATVIKHRSIPEGKFVKFELVGDGIKPAGFRIF